MSTCSSPLKPQKWSSVLATSEAASYGLEPITCECDDVHHVTSGDGTISRTV